jgi:hypothetical protein
MVQPRHSFTTVNALSNKSLFLLERVIEGYGQILDWICLWNLLDFHSLRWQSAVAVHQRGSGL